MSCHFKKVPLFFMVIIPPLCSPAAPSLDLGKLTQFKGVTLQAYPGKKNYWGVRISDFLKKSKIINCKNLQVKSRDGFTISFDSGYLSDYKAIPVLFYDQYRSWPSKSKYGGYVGPIYLGWIGSKSKEISREMWVWDVSEVSCIKDEDKLAQSIKNLNGYKLFKTNCSGCHDISDVSTKKIGPNLNYPMTPLEYFKSEEILKKFIRNPQSIRRYPLDRMISFSVKDISENELEDIIILFKKLKEARHDN